MTLDHPGLMREPPIIPARPVPPPVRLGRWPWILIAVLLLFYGAVGASIIGVVGMFRVSSETRNLRNQLAEDLGGGLDKQVEVSVGGVSFGLARWALGFTEVKPEIEAILKGIDAVEVGVYEVDPKDGRGGDMFATVEQALKNWERVVYVQDRDEVVAVYTRPQQNTDRLDVCAVVWSGKDLVIARVRSDVEELLNGFLNSDWLKELRRAIDRELS